MLLYLHGFHVKGDSHPPSQSPMLVENPSTNISIIDNNFNYFPMYTRSFCHNSTTLKRIS